MNASASGHGPIEKFFGGTGTSSSSRLTQDTPETPWNAHNNGRAKQPEDPGRPRYFITLAPSFSSTEDEDSSSSSASSVYDSIHNRETDFCQDSDDYDSDSSSDATIPAEREVIEFDVVTASSDDGDYLYVEDSSSGTDNYIIDKKIFVLQESKASWGGASARGSSFSSGTTTTSGSGNASEDSAEDSPDEDPELRPADYWKCVKCKNSQNNPRYRYCEKCYQLRKNYFPPRPKISKSRTRKNPRSQNGGVGGGHHHHHHSHHHNEQSSSDCATDEEEDEMKEQQQPRSPKRFKSNGSSSWKGNAAAAQSLAAASSSAVSSAEEGQGSAVNGASIVGRSVQLRDSSAGEEEEEEEVGGGSSSSINSSRRKRPNSSQDEEMVINNKMLKLTQSSDSGVASGESQEELRPKTLNLANVLLRGFGDSGCSSNYSSGHESIPSPVDGSSGGGGNHEVVGMELAKADSLLGPDQMTVSLSRDFYDDQELKRGVESKASYSDSETYRRTSSKCVVNQGRSHAIVRRVQGELLVGSKSAGLEEMRVGEGDVGELKATKSLMEQYEEQKEEDRVNNLCIICVSEPKDSAFVHARSLHISCCYKCAIKVWNKKKRCPICNCKVKNVLKCYVH